MKFVFIVVLVCLSGCVHSVTSNSPDWYFQIASPKHYDVWVEHIEFERSGVGRWSHPAGTLSCCWSGRFGPTGITGSMEYFPDYIGIQWFSLAEKKYYQRLIMVEPEWQQLMSQPAWTKSSQGPQLRPRNFLVFGLAPGGEIVIWMKGQIGNEIELARLQANELEGDPGHYSALLEGYRKEHGEYLRRNGVPLSGW